jgi:hypothetical protein
MSSPETDFDPGRFVREAYAIAERMDLGSIHRVTGSVRVIRRGGSWRVSARPSFGSRRAQPSR